MLTTVAAIPVWLLMARRKPGKPRADLLSEFERFFAEKRFLEADDTGWAFAYGTAINKRQWSDLFHMRESHRTFILSDAFASYILPKSTLSKEQIQQFKGFCERSLIPPRQLWSV